MTSSSPDLSTHFHVQNPEKRARKKTNKPTLPAPPSPPQKPKPNPNKNKKKTNFSSKVIYTAATNHHDFRYIKETCNKKTS